MRRVYKFVSVDDLIYHINNGVEFELWYTDEYGNERVEDPDEMVFRDLRRLLSDEHMDIRIIAINYAA